MDTTPGIVVYYKEGYKYQTQTTFQLKIDLHPPMTIGNDWVRLFPDGTLYIKEGYAWDGASGPTLDTKDSMRASLVHDSLYQLIRDGWLDDSQRAFADTLFRYLLRQDGMDVFRAWYWYTAVSKFGGKALQEKKETLSAP